MKAKQITFQAPRPEVRIYDPKSDNVKLFFSTSSKKVLREYSFKTSVDDVRGQFSLTFYPDEYDGSTPIFDQLNILDIVEIYESRNHISQYHKEGELVKKILPTFTGVIRSIKYASQISGRGVQRRLVVSGCSIVGLIADFYMSMDTSTQVLTEELAAQENVGKSLTVSLLENGNKPLKLEEVIKKTWDEFVNLSCKYKKISNPEIYNILEKWAGDFFDIDKELTFNYPLGCIFNAKITQAFFDIIEGIIPYQVYEKFAYMDRATGKMRIKIRECPFDEDKWNEAKYPEKGADGGLPLKLVKTLDIEQNDKEVYTVFFSYLDGYPIQMEKALILTKQNKESKSAPALVEYDEKYSKYGYRPLFVHFIGYSKAEGEDDTTTEEKLQKLNQRLKDWYGNIELMYHGQMSLATDLSMYMPQAGEVISFRGGEFYVTADEHKWTYKGNPETILTVTRGGVYTSQENENVTETVTHEPPKTYIVKQGDQIKKIAQEYYGSDSPAKIDLITNANAALLSSRPISLEGLPTIYALDKLTIPPDPDKAVKKEKKAATKKMIFSPLNYWGRENK